MGAWGYGPFESDNALDWIADDVEPILLAVIRGKILAFRRSGCDDGVEKDQAVAAAALLVLLCHPGKTYGDLSPPINLYHLAKEDDVFDQAIALIQGLLSNDSWVRLWSDPEKKRHMLQDLLRALQRLNDASLRRKGDAARSQDG